MLEPRAVNSASHYDTVTEAWGMLLGSSLHYGYFEEGATTLEGATHALTSRMLARLRGIGPGARVLDVGCGTGIPAQTIARRFGCAVTGISPSTACIATARAAAPHELGDLLRFQWGDAQAMDFADASFDVAWVMESSHLMLDKRRLFSELAWVVRPGGRMVLCDIMHVRELAMPEVMRRRDDFLLLARVFGRAIMRPSTFYASEASRAGFKDVRVVDLTAGTSLTFEHWRANAMANRDAVERLIGGPAWADFVAATRILEALWHDGVLGYFLLDANRDVAAGRCDTPAAFNPGSTAPPAAAGLITT